MCESRLYLQFLSSKSANFQKEKSLKNIKINSREFFSLVYMLNTTFSHHHASAHLYTSKKNHTENFYRNDFHSLFHTLRRKKKMRRKIKFALTHLVIHPLQHVVNNLYQSQNST